MVTDSGGGGQQMVRKNYSSMQCAVAIDKQRENGGIDMNFSPLQIFSNAVLWTHDPKCNIIETQKWKMKF